MTRILNDFLLFSCLVIFVRGVVLAAATLLIEQPSVCHVVYCVRAKMRPVCASKARLETGRPA
jgi:hypothetical protein